MQLCNHSYNQYAFDSLNDLLSLSLSHLQTIFRVDSNSAEIRKGTSGCLEKLKNCAVLLYSGISILCLQFFSKQTS